MAIIVIKDLPDNFELDRQAMLAIVGGARSRGQAPVTRRTFHRGPPAYLGTFSPAWRPSTRQERLRIYSARKPSIS